MSESKEVKNCAKWIIQKIKKEQELLVQDEELESVYGIFEDCGDSYRESVIKRKARIEVLIEVKISLEKYSKKLKYIEEKEDSEFKFDTPRGYY